MNLKLKTKKEQLEIAKNSTCPSELKILHNSQYMNVRRAVARNRNICAEVANNLAVDPVLNVSYMALQNPKSTITRDLCEETISSCVVCEEDERYLECSDCNNKKKAP